MEECWDRLKCPSPPECCIYSQQKLRTLTFFSTSNTWCASCCVDYVKIWATAAQQANSTDASTSMSEAPGRLSSCGTLKTNRIKWIVNIREVHIIVQFACSVAQGSQFSGRKCSFQAQLILTSYNAPPGWPGQKWDVAGRQCDHVEGWKSTDGPGVNGEHSG